MDVIIPTNLVCVLFGATIPTSSFNFIQLFFILVTIPFFIALWAKPAIHVFQRQYTIWHGLPIQFLALSSLCCPSYVSVATTLAILLCVSMYVICLVEYQIKLAILFLDTA